MRVLARRLSTPNGAWGRTVRSGAESEKRLAALSAPAKTATRKKRGTHSNVAVPLDEVVTVWCANTTWVIALRGYISSTQKEYWPALAGSR